MHWSGFMGVYTSALMVPGGWSGVRVEMSDALVVMVTQTFLALVDLVCLKCMKLAIALQLLNQMTIPIVYP